MTQFSITQLPRWLRDIGPLLFWMGLIFWLSSQSVLVEFEDPVEDKLFFKSAHLIAYAILAWLWWRALSKARRTAWPVLFAAFGLATLYGITDEIHQLFVPGRHGRVSDILFDAGGALLMILLIRRIHWLRIFPETLIFFSKKGEGKSSRIVSSQ